MTLVSGDWEWIDHLETYGFAFEAVSLDDPLDDFAPVFTARVAEALVRRQQLLIAVQPAQYGDNELNWEFDPVQLHWALTWWESDGGGWHWIRPDSEGYYHMAPLGWAFREVKPLDDPNEGDRILWEVRG